LNSGTRQSAAPRHRLCDLDSIGAALDASTDSRLALLLCRDGELSSRANDILALAKAKAIPILVESQREMRRMSEGDLAPELIALEGSPATSNLDELMLAAGLVFILVGLRYPGNVGFIIRSAEVAGAAGVILATNWKGSEFTEALRVGMRADRFFPVLEREAEEAIFAARQAGRRIVALETSGERSFWEADLNVPTAILVGGEATGIDERLLRSVDDTLRIPIRGFIPSYNVQAAVSMVLGEWLRQDSRPLKSIDG
jgi:tRNA G18 (ribose-2'-O)-methylase SpoU